MTAVIQLEVLTKSYGTHRGIVGQATVRALHERGVERDHVHQRAEPERAAGEAPADGELGRPDRRIEEQLDRVVSGLAMDLHHAREVRGAPVVEPIIVGEPGLRLRQGHELT